MLDQASHNKLVDVLLKLPVTATFEGRSSLLIGLPPIAANRNENLRPLDLNLIVDQLDEIGRIKTTGVRPLVVVVDNALTYATEGTDVSQQLRDIRQALEQSYAGEAVPPSQPPAEPEVLVFKGRDERVPLLFLERAVATARSVARLRVPRIFQGSYSEGDDSFGTGWLIAPGLIITNHHVIDARDLRYESHATSEDFATQAERTTAWFDYHREGGEHLECKDAELLASDISLDYALLQLREATKVADREPLQLVPQQPSLRRRDRLNIVQHSGGGPLGYAIRNNFYVGTGESADFLRYLTDTEPGASGSPVLNDAWQVVGLHHAATKVPPEQYAAVPQEPYQTLPDEITRGEVITYHNEGIAIHSILKHLAPDLRGLIPGQA